MPLDRTKAKRLINAVAAYQHHPGRDIITALGDQLTAALELIDGNASALIRAQNETALKKNELTEALEAYRRVQGEKEALQPAVEALKEIAVSAKGAQKKAVEVLTALGVPVPAKPEAAPKQEAAVELDES
jgi:hypothetical protein